MATTKRTPQIIPLLAGCSLALLMIPRQALAQECEADSDCGDGMICQEFESGCPEIAIACEADAECPEPEPCEGGTTNYCTEAPCESDDECGDNQVCYAYTFEACEPSADCDRDEECAEKELACEEQEGDAYCTAKYNVPCTEDADCGDGFTCDEREACGCSAGAGAPEVDPAVGGDGEAAASIAIEEECSCEPTGEFWCNLIEQECEEDDDCADGLVCGESPSLGVCSMSADGEESCSEPESTNTCMPVEWTSSFDLAVAETGVAQTAAASSGSAAGTGVANTSDASGASDAPTATDSRAGEEETLGDDALASDGESAASDMDSSEPKSGGGCQLSPAIVGATQPSAWSALLLALGLVVRRRR